LKLLSMWNTQLFKRMWPEASQIRSCGATILPVFLRSSHAHDKVSAVFVSTDQRNVSLSQGAFGGIWEDVESELRSVNFRRVSDAGTAFQSTLGLTENSNGWYRNTIHRNCNKFGNILRWHREHWVHLGVSPNQHRNHKDLLQDP
jgi:hypothetical protein